MAFADGTFRIDYSEGSYLNGLAYTGVVSLGNGSQKANMIFGVSTLEEGIESSENGLIGLGFSEDSKISFAGDGRTNFFDSLGFSGEKNKFGFYMSSTENETVPSLVTFGGVEESRFLGDIHYS